MDFRVSVTNYISLSSCLINSSDCNLQMVHVQRSFYQSLCKKCPFGDCGAVMWEVTLQPGSMCISTPVYTYIDSHTYIFVYIYTHRFCRPLASRVEFGSEKESMWTWICGFTTGFSLLLYHLEFIWESFQKHLWNYSSIVLTWHSLGFRGLSPSSSMEKSLCQDSYKAALLKKSKWRT